LTELAEMCDVVGIIEQGKVLAVGSVADIQRQGQQHERALVQLRILGGAEAAAQWFAAREDIHELKIDGENATFAHDGNENSEADLLRSVSRHHSIRCLLPDPVASILIMQRRPGATV
jgi:ABC-2 type transport system ATP-binding protein